MNDVPAQTDFLVIGAGVAGLRAAIELAAAGRVLVLAKQGVTESATHYAQGGVAAALSDEDEIGLHLQDTLTAGDGLCNPEAARILVEEGPQRIEELIAWGTEFDRSGTKLSFGQEGAHSRKRILHAHGDSTGREIGRALWEKVRTLKAVCIREFEFSTDLLCETGRVTGARLIDANGDACVVRAGAVLLATGGLGHVYRNTTNPDVATGDGVAMAFRAGAEISDMEFVQFHPTALYLKNAPRFLLSEALRGEGGYLRNDQLLRFMPKYHPLAELAPRDVVARAIAHELEVSRAKDSVVYLDLTHLSGKRLDVHFPRIYSTCLQYNIDITTDLIPIRPAAHYAMGGVRTDLEGQTSLAGLYAAGEVACTGVHGGNRLASNSLLEGLVYGARAARAMHNAAGGTSAQSATRRERTKSECAPAGKGSRAAAARAIGQAGVKDTASEETRQQVQELMWRDAGIVRTGSGLRHAIERLEQLRPCLEPANTRQRCETRNILETAVLIARSALAREESRGAHYRTDFPAHNDAKFLKHSVVCGDKIRFQ